ncbi:hypothetical protein BSKO_08623 [Bryopsis sp. KO-2023]|nr:hypothetical protein BSKO_08623 [Bryopsis sp. KO-2023]
MEEDKAHELYTHLQRFDASARHKQGLGFGSKKSNSDVWQKSNFIAFRKEGEEAPPSTLEKASFSKESIERRKRSRSPSRHRGRDSSRDRSRFDRESDLSRDRSRNRSRHAKGRDRSRGRRDGRERRGRKEKRSRSRSGSSRSVSREKRRKKDKHRRDGDRSRSRSRRRGSDRRSRRHRSRSSDFDRRSGRQHGDRSKRGGFVRSGGLSVDWSGQPATEKTEYNKKIPGFDSMTSVDQLKAKARYIEDRFGAENQESLARHHAALQQGTSDKKDDGSFGFHDPADQCSTLNKSEIAEELPTVLHTGILDTTRKLERAHEDAIFGKHASGPDSSSQPKAPTTAPTPAGIPQSPMDTTTEKGPLVSTQVILSQKTTSWRERAAWIKQRREGGL